MFSSMSSKRVGILTSGLVSVSLPIGRLGVNVFVSGFDSPITTSPTAVTDAMNPNRTHTRTTVTVPFA